MSLKIYHGDIVYAENANKLAVHENSYIVVSDGIIEGIYAEIPEAYKGAEVTDHGRGVIIPAFSDLHVHASQYIQRCLGMDCLLADWLNGYTFPQEAKFASLDYAGKIYDAYVEDMIRQGTFHAAIYATIHREATNYLFDKMEKAGLYGYVGKVNMDMNSPEYLCETVEGAMYETEKYLEEHSGAGTVKPILTPRFAPTCSRELLHGLGKLARKYHCGMQTHLVESRWEAAESLRLYPECKSDAEIYERAGLLDNGPSIFAHVIFPTAEDERIMKKYSSVAVHCPDATANIIAGIMPLKNLQEKGIEVCLGSDVGSGQHLAVYRQVARAVQFSKLKAFYEPEGNASIDFANAFYQATKAGGSVFGKVGSLEKGYAFNALVIDGTEDAMAPLTPVERLERFCYAGDDRNITARYLGGKAI